MSVPTWLAGSTVVIQRSANGYICMPRVGADPSECVVFETFAALTYYLGQNYQPPGP